MANIARNIRAIYRGKVAAIVNKRLTCLGNHLFDRFRGRGQRSTLLAVQM